MLRNAAQQQRQRSLVASYCHFRGYIWNLSDANYGGVIGDGSKTVYVRFYDNAGTVVTYSKSIALDTTFPTGSIAINRASLTSNESVTLTLSGSDGTGSGCYQMQFSNDGSTWYPLTTYSPSNFTWNLNDSSYGGKGGGGDKAVYVRYKDNAGNVISASMQIIWNGRNTLSSAASFLSFG